MVKNAFNLEKKLVAQSGKPGEYTRESPYAITTPNGIQCRICPHNCLLPEGSVGKCLTHLARDGKLLTTAYGNPCAVHADPIEKKPLYHFLPGTKAFSIATAGCNFTCLNCQNAEISQKGPENTDNVVLFPENVVEAAIHSGCRSIAYTYSEPVAFYEYMLDTARIARSHGIKNLMISNGFINQPPLRELCKYLDAANIDLKAFSNKIYAELSGGRLNPVLNTLKILRDEGVWVEITNLVIPGVTDDLTMIREMCEWLVKNGFADTPLHFSRFHPMFKMPDVPLTPVGVLNDAREIAMHAGIRFVYIGNVRGTNAENTFCPSCKKIIVEREGFRVGARHMNGDRCSFCGEGIAGIWE